MLFHKAERKAGSVGHNRGSRMAIEGYNHCKWFTLYIGIWKADVRSVLVVVSVLVASHFDDVMSWVLHLGTVKVSPETCRHHSLWCFHGWMVGLSVRSHIKHKDYLLDTRHFHRWLPNTNRCINLWLIDLSDSWVFLSPEVWLQCGIQKGCIKIPSSMNWSDVHWVTWMIEREQWDWDFHPNAPSIQQFHSQKWWLRWII